MKLKSIFLIGSLACAALVATSCDDDDDNKWYPTPGGGENEVLTKNFTQRYPDARNVEWEWEQGYYVADFNDGRHEVEAWFDERGEWTMSETDIRYEELPAEVRTAFEQGPYGTWRVDDVDLWEQANRSVIYILDVERGEQDINLHYSEYGDLINEGQGGQTGRPTPPTQTYDNLLGFIENRYPDARILEIDKDDQYIEVDILDGRTHKEVVFDREEQWFYTSWEIFQRDVPQIVMDALNVDYATYRIDDVDCVEYGEGLYYAFELERGERDLVVVIDSLGVIQDIPYRW